VASPESEEREWKTSTPKEINPNESAQMDIRFRTILKHNRSGFWE